MMTGQAVANIQGNYSQGDLPAPEQYGQLAALQQYMTKDKVVGWVQDRFKCTESQARDVLRDVVTVVDQAQNPADLLKCDPRTMLMAVGQAHQIGLSIDLRQHAHLVPFWNKDRRCNEAKLMIGWRGFVHRLREKLDGFDIHYGIVYEGDTFTIRAEGSRETYTHEVGQQGMWEDDPFKCMGAFCYIEYKVDGELCSIVSRMPRAELEKVKNVAKQKAIWNQWASEMIIKTVIRRACKRHFSTITDDLDQVDNEMYDMPAPHSASDLRSKPEDVARKMLQQNNPAQEQPDVSSEEDNNNNGVEAEETPPSEDEHGGEGESPNNSKNPPQGDSPDPSPEPERMYQVSIDKATPEQVMRMEEAYATEEQQQSINEAVEAEYEEVEEQSPSAIWDHRTLILADGKPIQENFQSVTFAAGRLITEMRRVKDDEKRMQMKHDNAALLTELIKQGHNDKFQAVSDAAMGGVE